MRSFTWLVLAMILLVGAGCAGPSWQRGMSAPHIEKSVFPVFVLSERAVEMSFVNSSQKMRTKFRYAATAVYVAPHLLAISSALFGSTTVNINTVKVANGDSFLGVQDVLFSAQYPDLAFIRTAEVGTPLVLRSGNFVSQEPFKLIGLAFNTKSMADVRGKTMPVVPAEGISARVGDCQMFLVGTDVKKSGVTAGSVILDSRQRLVGIVNRGYYDRVSTIDASTIRRALREVDHE